MTGLGDSLTWVGMFLWVRLILDDLNTCYSLAELRKTAEELPKGIEEA